MTEDCCITQATFDGSAETVATDVSSERCRKCEGPGRPVSRRTVLLMLKPELLGQAMAGIFSFCSDRACPVVYFEVHGGQAFTTDDLRVPVGVKASGEPILLCYCFGFNESHLRNEISQTGIATIPERISTLIRSGLCACESRNPAGVCCLGEVNRAAKRIKATIQCQSVLDSGTNTRL